MSVENLTQELATARAQIAALESELADLNILYEATIEHGEAVEDQLAENNILLQQTQNRLAAELNDATQYIMSTIPEPRVSNPSTEWLLIPSTELGGDAFGYHEIDDDHMAFYLLDVCGHGVGAALLSVTAINVLRSSTLPHTDFRDPSAVLGALNEAFPMEKQNNMYFTIWYGVFQRSTNRLHYASAGHPPSILLRDNGDGQTQAVELTVAGMVLGAFAGMTYDSATTDIQAGDRLMIFSDGTFEVETAPGVMLSFADYVDFLRQPDGHQPQRILSWVKSLNGDGPLPDDFSLLSVAF